MRSGAARVRSSAPAPCSTARPERGRSRPESVSSVVDLPAPLAPISAVSVPVRDGEGHVLQHVGGAAEDVQPLDLKQVGMAPPGAEVGLDDARVGLHLGGRAFGDQPAAVQHLHAPAEAHDQPHVVLDHQHRDAELGVDAADHAAEGRGLGRVQPGRRLVEQQRRRLGRQRAGDLDPALVAVAEVAGPPARRAGRGPSRSMIGAAERGDPAPRRGGSRAGRSERRARARRRSACARRT